MVVGAGAAADLIAVNTNLIVLAAVQDGESVAQPELQRPEGDTTSVSVQLQGYCCIGYYIITHLSLSLCIFFMLL